MGLLSVGTGRKGAACGVKAIPPLLDFTIPLVPIVTQAQSKPPLAQQGTGGATAPGPGSQGPPPPPHRDPPASDTPPGPGSARPRPAPAAAHSRLQGQSSQSFSVGDEAMGGMGGDFSYPLTRIRRSRSSGMEEAHTYNILRKPYEDVREKYALGAEIGRGQYGVIRHCSDRRSGERLAAKVISKRRLAGLQAVEDVQREIRAMLHLAGHTAVIALRATYEDVQRVYLIMELCEGGELYDRITMRKRYSEADAAEVCRQLAGAVRHFQARGMVHRDLKPENVILVSRASDTELKVVDYGLAAPFTQGQPLTLTAGSAYYIAPEVLNGSYGPEVDMWSIGVILYIMLCGLPPFWHKTEAGIFDAILSGKFDIAGGPWKSVSQGAKDLVCQLLTMDPARRATPHELLVHPWISEHCGSPTPAYSDSESDSCPIASVVTPNTLAAVQKVPSGGSDSKQQAAGAMALPDTHRREQQKSPLRMRSQSAGGSTSSIPSLASSLGSSPPSVSDRVDAWFAHQSDFMEDIVWRLEGADLEDNGPSAAVPPPGGKQHLGPVDGRVAPQGGSEGRTMAPALRPRGGSGAKAAAEHRVGDADTGFGGSRRLMRSPRAILGLSLQRARNPSI